MKKKIIITISVLIVIIAVAILVFNLNQRTILIEEIKYISEGIDPENPDFNKINENLDTIKTKGKFANVEKAIKRYFKDFFYYCIELDGISRSDELSNMLTANNFKEDGPNFEKTKKYINDTRNKLKQIKINMLEFFTEEKINSYFSNMDLSNYIINIFTRTLSESEEFKSRSKDVEISMDECINIINQSDKIIDLLKDNKGKWEIDGDTIVFYNTSLMKQYNSLIEELTESYSESI